MKIVLYLILSLSFISCSFSKETLNTEEQNIFNFFMGVHLQNTFKKNLIKENNVFMESQYKTTCLRLIDRFNNKETPINRTKGRLRVPGILNDYDLPMGKEKEIYHLLSNTANWSQVLQSLNQGVVDFNNRNFSSPYIAYYYISSYMIAKLNSPALNIFNESYSKKVKNTCNLFVTKNRVIEAIKKYNKSLNQ